MVLVLLIINFYVASGVLTLMSGVAGLRFISKSNKNSSANSISCEKGENIQLFSYFKYFCFLLSLCLYTCICTPFSQAGSIHGSSHINDISSINDNSSCVSNTTNNDESISLESSILNSLNNFEENINLMKKQTLSRF